MGVPRITGTFVGVCVTRVIIFWGLYPGPLILGNYHMILVCLEDPQSEAMDFAHSSLASSQQVLPVDK